MGYFDPQLFESAAFDKDGNEEIVTLKALDYVKLLRHPLLMMPTESSPRQPLSEKVVALFGRFHIEVDND